jgi:CRISPR-associated protein Csb1
VKKAADKTWTVAGPDAKGKGIESPSAVNHSSVPFPKQRAEKTDENTYDGVTIEYAEQTSTLSLICLRRLAFPINGKPSPAADAAARTVLAALGLAAATLAFECGAGLRSRCLLWPDGPMEWELLSRPGMPPSKFTLTGESASKLLADAVSAARSAGLPWAVEPVLLKPSKELVDLVRLSQLEATKDNGESA